MNVWDAYNQIFNAAYGSSFAHQYHVCQQERGTEAAMNSRKVFAEEAVAVARMATDEFADAYNAMVKNA